MPLIPLPPNPSTLNLLNSCLTLHPRHSPFPLPSNPPTRINPKQFGSSTRLAELESALASQQSAVAAAERAAAASAAALHVAEQRLADERAQFAASENQMDSRQLRATDYVEATAAAVSALEKDVREARADSARAEALLAAERSSGAAAMQSVRLFIFCHCAVLRRLRRHRSASPLPGPTRPTRRASRAAM